MVLNNVDSGVASGLDNIDKKGIRVTKDRSSVTPLIINKILKNINFLDLLGIINLIIAINDIKGVRFEFIFLKNCMI